MVMKVTGLLVLVFLSSSSIMAQYQKKPFERCVDDNKLFPTFIKFEHCNDKICTFRKGANVTGLWHFTVPSTSRTLKPRIRAIIGNLPVDYEFDQANACDALKLPIGCPVVRGQAAVYALSMPIDAKFPFKRFSANFEFALLDDKGNAVMCFRAPVIVDGPEKSVAINVTVAGDSKNVTIDNFVATSPLPSVEVLSSTSAASLVQSSTVSSSKIATYIKATTSTTTKKTTAGVTKSSVADTDEVTTQPTFAKIKPPTLRIKPN